MALKAYKHLTDGEVKLVEEGSAEEASLLADVVTGASYLQLTSAGHAQEVAATQGTALWEDVSADPVGGHVFEVTDLAYLAGDTPEDVELGSFDLDPWQYIYAASLYLEVSSDDEEFQTITLSVDTGQGVFTEQGDKGTTPLYKTWTEVSVFGGVTPNPARTITPTISVAGDVGGDGKFFGNITVVRARAAFLVL